MQRSGTKRCAIWKVWESASHLVLPTRGAALLASSNTADQGSVSDLTASVGSSALDAFFSSGFGSSRELTSASGFVSGSVLSLSSCSVFWRLCKFWLKRGFLAGDSRSSLLWHTIWSGDTATWTWEQISRAILRAKPWQYDAQKRDTRWTPKPGNRWLPSMRWCWCWLWHNFWSNSKNTCLEVVNTWLLFRMKRSVCGMRSPNWHMSKMALAVCSRILWKTFNWYMVDPKGCSKWKCRWCRIWYSQIWTHSLTWIISLCCWWWMWSNNSMLLCWFKRFHPPQGPHSGATQMCSGSYISIHDQSLWRPANVLKSPSDLVNRIDLWPQSDTAAAKGLWLSA